MAKHLEKLKDESKFEKESFQTKFYETSSAFEKRVEVLNLQLEVRKSFEKMFLKI